MKQITESSKSVEQATADLQEAVKKHGFGVLHIYDLKATLKEKGAPIENECRVLEVCNPQQAQKVLSSDMSMNMALPCRVSVYEQDGRTRIGLLSPKEMLGLLSDRPELADVAAEVEAAMQRMIEDAK
ncbi:DUF302 domain-containing protein [Lentisalinibacter salinarum]|uniref:DUF302 domain-containing protein n=1 Tax=Lentisalinibacter salinarum TaxID=2992239 RepID=UPI00386797AC